MKTRQAAGLCLGVLVLIGALIFGCSSSSLTPRFLVVPEDTGSAGANVDVFAINASTGALTAPATAANALQDLTIKSPQWAVTHPNGHWVVVGDGISASVRVWDIDAAGKLTQISIKDLVSGDFEAGNRVGLAVTPNGNCVYTAETNAAVGVFSVNASTGALTVGTEGAILPGGFSRALAATNTNVYVVDGDTYDPDGNLVITVLPITSASDCTLKTKVQDYDFTADTSSTLWGITVDPSGKFLYVGTSSGALIGYSIDATTGKIALLQAETTIGSSFVDAIGFTSDSKFIYASDADAGLIGASLKADGKIDSTVVSGSSTGLGGALVVDRSNQFIFAAEDCGNVHSFKRNTATGGVTEVSTGTTSADNACSLAVTY